MNQVFFSLEHTDAHTYTQTHMYACIILTWFSSRPTYIAAKRLSHIVKFAAQLLFKKQNEEFDCFALYIQRLAVVRDHNFQAFSSLTTFASMRDFAVAIFYTLF